MQDNYLYTGFIRLHILYHAVQGPIFGLGIIEELRRHGYDLSPGTLYPLLHRMEHDGYLSSEAQKAAGKLRRVYHVTLKGRAALDDAKLKVRELFGELFEED